MPKKAKFTVENSILSNLEEEFYEDVQKLPNQVDKRQTLYEKSIQNQKAIKSREKIEILYGKKLIDCIKSHFFRNEGKEVRILFLSPVWNKNGRGEMELLSIHSIEWKFDQNTRKITTMSKMSVFVPRIGAVSIRPFGVKPLNEDDDEVAEDEIKIKKMILNKYLDYAVDTEDNIDRLLVFETREMADAFTECIPFEENLMMLLHDIIPLTDVASVLAGKNFSHLRHVAEAYGIKGQIDIPAKRVEMLPQIFKHQLKIIRERR